MMLWLVLRLRRLRSVLRSVLRMLVLGLRLVGRRLLARVERFIGLGRFARSRTIGPHRAVRDAALGEAVVRPIGRSIVAEADAVTGMPQHLPQGFVGGKDLDRRSSLALDHTQAALTLLADGVARVDGFGLRLGLGLDIDHGAIPSALVG